MTTFTQTPPAQTDFYQAVISDDCTLYGPVPVIDATDVHSLKIQGVVSEMVDSLYGVSLVRIHCSTLELVQVDSVRAYHQLSE